MADDSANKAYPYMFDPSQMSNKYSPYAGMALPFMGGYSTAAGPPTDTHGNPIQSYQDAQAAHDAWAAANPAPQAAPVTLNTNPNQWAINNAMINGMGRALPAANPGGSLPGQSGQNGMYDRMSQMGDVMGMRAMNNAGLPGMGLGGATPMNSVPGATQAGAMGGPPGGAGAPGVAGRAAATNPVDMGQAYLTALANPGKVTTPGATVPQAAPPSNQSGVLQQFLQNWGGNSKGAGNYDNSGFINSLRGMV